jgi:hypothetical protein
MLNFCQPESKMPVKAWKLPILGLLLTIVLNWGQVISHDAVKVTRTNYRGWQNSIILSNPQVEVVIVPAIGRVMQFRFKDVEATFWENRKLDGKPPNCVQIFLLMSRKDAKAQRRSL